MKWVKVHSVVCIATYADDKFYLNNEKATNYMNKSDDTKEFNNN